MTTPIAAGSISRNSIEAITKWVYLDHAAATPMLCAIGIRPDLAQGSLVFTLSRDNLEKESELCSGATASGRRGIALFLPGLEEENGRRSRSLKMKLSAKSRYGTRLMLDMAQHYQDGPIHLTNVAKRQGISVKYLEQIIIPLKKANYIQSVRGPKGGHVLARPPEEITVGEIVALLEDGASLSACSDNPMVCERSPICPTRYIWQEAAQAMFDKLRSITLADLLKITKPSPAGQKV